MKRLRHTEDLQKHETNINLRETWEYRLGTVNDKLPGGGGYQYNEQSTSPSSYLSGVNKDNLRPITLQRQQRQTACKIVFNYIDM